MVGNNSQRYSCYYISILHTLDITREISSTRLFQIYDGETARVSESDLVISYHIIIMFVDTSIIPLL